MNAYSDLVNYIRHAGTRLRQFSRLNCQKGFLFKIRCFAICSPFCLSEKMSHILLHLQITVFAATCKFIVVIYQFNTHYIVDTLIFVNKINRNVAINLFAKNGRCPLYFATIFLQKLHTSSKLLRKFRCRLTRCK